MNDDQDNFDDSLHALVFATRRPSKDPASQELQQLQSTFSRLISLCGQDEQRWKTLLLGLAYKRYHVLSPQAKAEAAVDGSNNKKDITAGQGERLIVYTAARILFEQVQSNHEDKDEQWATKALSVLCRLAPLAGGARDICALIQDFVHILLEQELKQKRDNMMTCYGKESLPSLVASGVQVLCNDDSNAISASHAVLNYLVQLAADLLDCDFDIVDRENHKDHDKEQQQQEDKLPSTIHMYIPHRDRGRAHNNKKRQHEAEEQTKTKVSDRQLVNSVAEILIWSKTVTASSNNVFVACYEKILQGSTSQDNNKDVKTNLFTLQTIIRKKRQQLNSYARNKGFMLSDQFVLDPHVLNLQRIRRGKAGDIASLTRLAKKKQDTHVLELIHMRFSDPAKATKFGSIIEMMSAWTTSAATAADQQPTAENQVDKNEIVQLERDILFARAKATIKYLSNVAKTIKKSVLIASMDVSPANHVAAVLVAAALSGDVDVEQDDADNIAMSDATKEQVRLFIGGVPKSIHSFDSVFNLLDEIICGTNKNEVDAPSFMTGHTATTKAVLNMMERHLHDKEALVLLSSADILVPSDVMRSLTARGCGIHCHDADVIGERLAREGARKGDITISLAWDTEDDLDLHVIIPSGEHIYYSSKKSRDGLCMLDVDMNAGGGGSTEPVENVFCGDVDAMKGAPKGHYEVVVQNYAYYKKSGHPILFRVVVEKNGTKESFSGECIGSGSKSDVVVYEFDYDGRSVPFPSEDGGGNTAFGTSNMVNLSASTGQTIESLGQLTQTLAQLEHLDEARQLVNEDEREEEKEEAGEDSMMEESRPLLAGQGTLEVTSRDLLRIHLAKLPPRFHQIIGETFGGPTLAEECAKELGQRMMADKVPISELKRHGYPDDIVQLVKKQMATATAP